MINELFIAANVCIPLVGGRLYAGKKERFVFFSQTWPFCFLVFFFY